MSNLLPAAITPTVTLHFSLNTIVFLLGSNKKMNELISWKPGYDLDAGLKETIEWFKLHSDKVDYKTKIYNI